MDPVDELTRGHARASTAGDPVLRRPLAGRSVFSDAENGLPGRTTSLRTRRAFPAVSGDLPDRNLANFIRLPAGSRTPRQQLQRRLRSCGMAVGLLDRGRQAASREAADAAANGAPGGPTGWLRQPQASRRTRCADRVAGAAAPA